MSLKTNEGGRARVCEGKVLVVGLGGLGSPAALTLALAGVGTLGLVDADRVELSNLHRQILHFTPDIGKPKVDSAREKIRQLNPSITVEAHNERLHAGNLADIFAGYDFILDATDGVATKFLINDGAVLLNKPLSHAGIVQFHGQALTVLPRQTTCLRCLFPVPPQPDENPTCQEAGILGSLAGSLGSVQAAEAVKYLSGDGDLLTDRLLTYDALTLRWREVRVRPSRHCPLCGPQRTITALQPETYALERLCAPA